ncbi:MAG: putative lipoprotein [Ignavibacteria bacterium]|nr:putative lipoprotein [Ignavibacteria bacterium]
MLIKLIPFNYILIFIGLFFQLNSALGNSIQSNDSLSSIGQKLYLSLTDALKEPLKVYKLCLGGQSLGTIPPDIELLKNLLELNVTQNSLTTLPNGFSSLKNLIELNLSSNDLKVLPTGFENLVLLEKLDISGNPQLIHSRTVEVIARMKQLQILNLGSNDLTELPQNISKLTFLRELYLEGNTFSESEKNNIKSSLPSTKIFFD